MFLKKYKKKQQPNDDWGRVHDCWQQWWDKQKKITWSPSICRNASIRALRREKQAKLRLGWSQHGEKSLKFHLINSIVEYAKKKKKSKFSKAKICKPIAQFIQRYNCVCPCCDPLVIRPHRSGCDQSEQTDSSIYSDQFILVEWLCSSSPYFPNSLQTEPTKLCLSAPQTPCGSGLELYCSPPLSIHPFPSTRSLSVEQDEGL